MDAAAALVEALGGPANVIDIEPCSMRVRVQVSTQSHVRENDLRLPEVLGVVRSGDIVQIITGLQTETIAHNMRVLVDVGHDTSPSSERG